MGGTNEKSIQNLRFHVNGDEVHVHDDISKKKFYCKKDFFKKEMKEILEALENTDGIMKIESLGCSTLSPPCLYVMRECSQFIIFLGTLGNVERQLKDFVKDC